MALVKQTYIDLNMGLCFERKETLKKPLFFVKRAWLPWNLDTLASREMRTRKIVPQGFQEAVEVS